MPNKQIPTEDIEQIKVVQYLSILKRSGKILKYWATLNENKEARSVRVGQKLKSLGKEKGISDLTIVFKNFTLYIEMKRQLETLKNGKKSNSHSKPTEEQQEFIDTMNKTTHSIGCVAYGGAMAIEILDAMIKSINAPLDDKKSIIEAINDKYWGEVCKRLK